MAKISAQTLATAPVLTDQFVVARAGANRRMPLSMVRNVPWVNVMDYGAVGDLVADDTAACQAAFDACPSGGNVYIPKQHKITATLDPGTVGKIVNLVGSRAPLGLPPTADSSLLQGAFAGPLYKSLGGAGVSGPIIQGVNFINTVGKAIHLEGWIGSCIRECYVGAVDVGIYLPEETVFNAAGLFTCLISHVLLAGPGAVDPSTFLGIGIATAGHTMIHNCDITRFAVGVQAGAAHAVNVSSCRIEVCKTGVLVGKSPRGLALPLSGFYLTGNTYEACDIAIHVKQGLTGRISDSVVLMEVNSPSTNPGGVSSYGLWIENATRLTVENFDAGGAAYGAAIRVDLCRHTKFARVSAGNGIDAGKRWDIREAVTADHIIFEQTDYTHMGTGPDGAVRVGTDTRLTGIAADQTVTHAVAGYDLTQPPVAGKNLRRIGTAVTETATTLAVLFPREVGQGEGQINQALPTTGGTLADGTYYYLGTVVNEYGETGGDVGFEEVAVVAGADNAVNITSSALDFGQRWHRRVYRGRASGVYDGFYDLPMNSSATYLDTGAPFHGQKSPPNTEVSTAAQEPDANYGVWVAPNWGTTWWITNKATTGFTIHFGTAAPAAAVADWMLLR